MVERALKVRDEVTAFLDNLEEEQRTGKKKKKEKQKEADPESWLEKVQCLCRMAKTQTHLAKMLLEASLGSGLEWTEAAEALTKMRREEKKKPPVTWNQREAALLAALTRAQVQAKESMEKLEEVKKLLEAAQIQM